ncbi:MAG: GyrI-like domain-containing protein [Phycisphaerales bacterium]|nr:GyrI-like domain-containing protein [Phycisphaerales bacterium]
MTPHIVTIKAKMLVGIHLEMSLSNNKTVELWQRFMPMRNTITNPVHTDLISLQDYGADFDFKDFSPHIFFKKWAALEVQNFNDVPQGMQAYTITGGLYAIFLYKGDPRSGASFFDYIFNTWLPRSAYCVDNRPHFEILGSRYKHNDPNSEEEVWIPIRIR